MFMALALRVRATAAIVPRKCPCLTAIPQKQNKPPLLPKGRIWQNDEFCGIIFNSLPGRYAGNGE